MTSPRVTHFLVWTMMGALAFSARAFDSPEAVITAYVKALEEARWDDAELCWDTRTVERSHRLGIAYTDVPIKLDCASPLPAALMNMSPQTASAGEELSWTVSAEDVTADRDTMRFTVWLVSKTDDPATAYYTEKTSRGWRLTSPLYYYSRGWKVRQTEYVDVYYADESLVNDHACLAMDGVIETVGAKLGLTPDDFAALRQERIDYFLGSGDDMRRMTGFETQGMADLQTDAVVSRSLPHEHELTHLLVNYRLKRLPLYTLPLLQEGLAAYCGGRWSKSPQAIAYQGCITLSNEIGRLDDLLTRAGFLDPAVGAEVSYPIAALFAGFLLERWGIETYLTLYAALSGSDDQIGSFDAGRVKATIEMVYGVSWADMASGFEQYWKQLPLRGVLPDTSRPSGRPDFGIETAGVRVSIWNDTGLVHVVVDLPAEVHEGVLLIPSASQTRSSTYRSWLFAERLPRATYSGDHIGIRFSASEAAVYDFLTNKLLASYIEALSPQPGYRDSVSGTLRFAVAADLLRDIDLARARLVVP
ncbi:MAG: hypothetical protein GYA46_00055 [candidate division Zixibacteria bacterium]|nr:hypothetical protein [candidate division Zixibacteria bacterium]